MKEEVKKYLVITNPERFSRSLKEYSMYVYRLKCIGIEVVTDDPAGRFGLAISQHFNSYTTQQRTKAIKRGMTANAERGLLNGKPPLGYTKTVKPGLYEPTELGEFLGDVLKAFAAGRITFHMAHIALEHVTGHTGTPKLRRSSAISFLSNPYYAGLVVWQGKAYKGLHEPLITQEQHQAILSKLERRAVNPTQVA